MNLLTKTSLLITTVALFILMMGGIIFFIITKELINKQVDRELVMELHANMRHFDRLVLPSDTAYFDNITIFPDTQQATFITVFNDTIRYNDFEREYQAYRVLEYRHSYGGKIYRIEVYKSLLDSTILIERITLVWISLSFILILAIFFLNKIIFKRTWKDFFNTLKVAESYDIKNPKKEIKLVDSEINEFNSLNRVLSQLLARVESDYRNQKELTANTSHELQTPLAIIKSKAELLIQEPGLTTRQVHLISEILNTTDRLSRLNKSLLTISRIENNQFKETEIIQLEQVLRTHIKQFRDLIDERQHQLVISLNNTVKIMVNPVLFDLLLVNLLGNAIIHNLKNKGKIVISYNAPLLTIANTGPRRILQENKIFQRYYKKSDNPNSSGIGLSIVKKICNYYDMEITYSFTDHLHIFSLNLSGLIVQNG